MANPQFLRFFFVVLLIAGVSTARGVTYVVLWFDTEDYIDPIADDAALRIANDLTSDLDEGTQGGYRPSRQGNGSVQSV